MAYLLLAVVVLAIPIVVCAFISGKEGNSAILRFGTLACVVPLVPIGVWNFLSESYGTWSLGGMPVLGNDSFPAIFWACMGLGLVFLARAPMRVSARIGVMLLYLPIMAQSLILCCYWTGCLAFGNCL